MPEMSDLAETPAPTEAPEGPWVDEKSGYWAAEKRETLAATLVTKIQEIRNDRAPLFMRARANWYAYYGLDNGAASWDANLYTHGAEGEKLRLRVNVARTLVQHIYINTTSVKPSITPLAKNTDAASTKSVGVATAVAQDVMDNHGGYETADKATLYAEVLDQSFVSGDWEWLAGGPVGIGPDGKPLHRGELRFRVKTIQDVLFDLALTSWDEMRWVIDRHWANKYDIAADFPDQKDAILAQQGKTSFEVTQAYELPNPCGRASDESDMIEVFTFWHRKSPAMPQGRRLMMLSTGVWLEDGPLEYKDVPVWPLVAEGVIGTALGTGPMTSLGSSQEAFNKMMSVMATTLFTHGVSNIAVAKGSNVDVTDAGGGQQIWEVDVPAGGNIASVVAPINLTDLPEAVPKFAEMLSALMTQTVGLNKIVQGDPSGVTAGVALSLFQAMAQQFQGPLENGRARLIMQMILWSFEAYRVHSDAMPRLVQMVGRSKREALTEFLGADLDGMERVEVTLGNPLTRTPAGKVQMVQLLKQDGQPLPPQVVQDVLDTGKSEVATDPDSNELDLIRAENEMLLEGGAPVVQMGQDDALHLFHHCGDVGMDPNIAQDPDKQQLYMQHIQGHLKKMSEGDMILLARRGMLTQGFANPMFNQITPPQPGADGKPPAQGSKPGDQKAPPPKPEGGPGTPPPNPTAPMPLSGPSPQQ